MWLIGSEAAVLRLSSTGSIVWGHRLSCSSVCGIFHDQGWKLCPLLGRLILNHWNTSEVAGPLIYDKEPKIYKEKRTVSYIKKAQETTIWHPRNSC